MKQQETLSSRVILCIGALSVVYDKNPVMILNTTQSKFSEFDKTFFFTGGTDVGVQLHTTRVHPVGSKCSCFQSESRSYVTTFIAHSSLVGHKYHSIMCPTGTVNGHRVIFCPQLQSRTCCCSVAVLCPFLVIVRKCI